VTTVEEGKGVMATEQRLHSLKSVQENSHHEGSKQPLDFLNI
jgi:hypothetical protein